MILTEDYVRKTIEEVAPLIEEESQLKCNLIDYSVDLLTFKKIAKDRGCSLKSAHKLYGSYKHNYFGGLPELMFPKKYLGNLDLFKKTVSHECFHNAQFSNFPYFYIQYNDPEFCPQNISEENFLFSLRCLADGDATLIENILSKKYFKNPHLIYKNRRVLGINKNVYLHGEKVLRQKFNDGKDRKGINELYSAPVEELVKIFGVRD